MPMVTSLFLGVLYRLDELMTLQVYLNARHNLSFPEGTPNLDNIFDAIDKAAYERRPLLNYRPIDQHRLNVTLYVDGHNWTEELLVFALRPGEADSPVFLGVELGDEYVQLWHTNQQPGAISLSQLNVLQQALGKHLLADRLELVMHSVEYKFRR